MFSARSVLIPALATRSYGRRDDRWPTGSSAPSAVVPRPDGRPREGPSCTMLSIGAARWVRPAAERSQFSAGKEANLIGNEAILPRGRRRPHSSERSQSYFEVEAAYVLSVKPLTSGRWGRARFGKEANIFGNEAILVRGKATVISRTKPFFPWERSHFCIRNEAITCWERVGNEAIFWGSPRVARSCPARPGCRSPGCSPARSGLVCSKFLPWGPPVFLPFEGVSAS